MTEKNRKRNDTIIDAIRRMQAGEHARMCLDLLGWNYCDEKRKAAVLDELEELNEAVEDAEEAEVVFWGYTDDMINRIVKDMNVEFGYQLDCDDCCQLLRSEVVDYLYKVDLTECDNFLGSCISFLKNRLVEYLGLELSCGTLHGWEYRKLKKSGAITGGRIVFFFGEYNEEENDDGDTIVGETLPKELMYDPTNDLLDNIGREQIREKLRETFKILSEEERMLINLRFYKGLSLSKIAYSLGEEHVSTIKRKLDRTVKKLGELLNSAGALEGMRSYYAR